MSNKKNQILDRISTIASFSEHFPGILKTKFSEDLEKLKESIEKFNWEDASGGLKPISSASGIHNKALAEITDPPPPFSFQGSATVQEPPPGPKPVNVKSVPSFQPLPGKLLVMNSTPNKPVSKLINDDSRPAFIQVTDALIPKLTKEGKKAFGDFSMPIKSYLILKMIDDKTSLFRLFTEHHNKSSDNFIEFANVVYQLELDKYITFIKTQETVKDRGIIKFEETLSEGKVISREQAEAAVKRQRETGSLLINQIMLDMKLITSELANQALRIQKWVPRMFEHAKPVQAEAPVINAPAVKAPAPLQGITPPPPVITAPGVPVLSPVIHHETAGRPEEELVAGILDFIIPLFNEKGESLLADPKNQALAERLRIIDGQSSIFKIYNINKVSFKEDKLAFLKFILKLDSQNILAYKENSRVEERQVRIMFGELLLNMDLIDSQQLEYALALRDEKNIKTGEAMTELGYIEAATVEECLKIQSWLNQVLDKLSYEINFVDVISSVLKDTYKCEVEIGSLRKTSFPNPVKDIVCIRYPITGKLNGFVYYISDRAFMQSLARTLNRSLGKSHDDSDQEFDESSVGVVNSVIISNSLAKLSQMGLFNSSEMVQLLMKKEVSMDKEIVIAEGKTISLIPLINQTGRFAIGLDVA